MTGKTGFDSPAPAKPKTVKAFVVPAAVFAAMRQVIGQLPYDQVGKLCRAMDEECEVLEE